MLALKAPEISWVKGGNFEGLVPWLSLSFIALGLPHVIE
jgi:hypothetical protein